MTNVLIVVALTLLCAANIFLLCVMVYFNKKKTDKATRIGFAFMEAVLVLNTLFSIGGACLW